MRVIDQVEPGEKILVPFCGVGPFAIPAAAKGAHVVAVEQNPDAYFWLEENISLNKVRKNITTIHGDACNISLLPHHKFGPGDHPGNPMAWTGCLTSSHRSWYKAE